MSTWSNRAAAGSGGGADLAAVQAQIDNDPEIQAALQRARTATTLPERRYWQEQAKQAQIRSGIQLPHDYYFNGESGQVQPENFFQRNPWVAPAIPFAGAAGATALAGGGAAAAGGGAGAPAAAPAAAGTGTAAGSTAAGGTTGGILLPTTANTLGTAAGGTAAAGTAAGVAAPAAAGGGIGGFLSSPLGIASLIGGGGNVLTSLIGARAAGKASQQQQEAIDKALAAQGPLYDRALSIAEQQHTQGRADLQPYATGGAQGMTALTALLGLPAAPAAAAAPAGVPLARLGGGASGGGTVLLRAPNGQTKAVSPDQVDYFVARGATRV